jgi:tetratricopeptide (TPR) repeat protein
MRQSFPRFLIPALCLLALALPAGAQTAQELFEQGAAAYGSSDWPKCAELFAKAGVAFPSDSQAARSYFAAAACSAAAGQKEAAFGYLDKAAAKGHRDVDRATGNPQVKALHDDPRWKTFLAGVEARAAEHEKKNNAEIKRIHDEDQEDRRPGPGKIDWTVVGKRDEERRARMTQILAEGGAKTTDDYFHAAMVFQHGTTIDEIARAHELALKAAEFNPPHPNARWLAAASKDRWLMDQGKPQLYGTQYKTANGKTVLWEVDPSVTDEERAKWDCPPLAVAKARAEEMNRQ